MTGSNERILNMIKNNKSIEEISKETNLSYRQLYYRFNQLQNHGYNISREYNTNGIIDYNVVGKRSYSTDYFKLNNTQNNFKIILLSDIHMGNKKCDEEALSTIYEYCIKNDIHVILICGDLVEGKGGIGKLSVPMEDQIEYFIKNYPFDKSIINLYTCGNHDKVVYDELNISLTTALNARRHDICSLKDHRYITNNTINNNILLINNNKILISHINSSNEIKDKNIKLHIMGHRHACVSVFKDDAVPEIYVPSIIRQNAFAQIHMPRAIELEIYLDSEKNFELVNKKDLIILNNKTLLTSETIINYSDKDIKPFKYINKGSQKDDIKKEIEPKKHEEPEKELGELSDSAKNILENFYDNSNDKISKMLKKAKKPNRHSYK